MHPADRLGRAPPVVLPKGGAGQQTQLPYLPTALPASFPLSYPPHSLLHPPAMPVTSFFYPSQPPLTYSCMLLPVPIATALPTSTPTFTPFPLPTYPPSHYPQQVCGQVCDDLVSSVLAEMVLEVVNSVINDIIFRYNSWRWAASGRNPGKWKTRPPSQPELIRLPLESPVSFFQRPHTSLSSVGCSYLGGGRGKRRGRKLEKVSERREKLEVVIPTHLQEKILKCQDRTELCSLLSGFLLENLLFSQLLTSDLSGGATMATRTQSLHLFNGLLFEELLTTQLTSPTNP